MSTETNNVLVDAFRRAGRHRRRNRAGEQGANLLRAVRADGVIVKPDASIVPLDRSYIADAQQAPAPLTASTYTDHDGVENRLSFCFQPARAPGGQRSFFAHRTRIRVVRIRL